MSGDLGTVRNLQDFELANSKTGNFEESEREQAINDALLEVMEYAQWSQFKTSSTITFDTDGEGALPTNFFYDLEDLYEPNTVDGTRSFIYKKVDKQVFVRDVHGTYIFDDDGSGTEILKIQDKPSASLDLTFFYIKRPWTDDLSESSDETGFGFRFDRVLAKISAAILEDHKNPTGGRGKFLRYGNGNDSEPSSGSAYRMLSRLYAYYKKIYTPRRRFIKSVYDLHSFGKK